jgi:hypothetical protein
LFIVSSKIESEDLRWYLLQNKIHEARIREAFQLFRANGIEPILIKGWAIARLYPESRLRTYTDIDLGVPSGDIEKARIILDNDSAKKLNIDLHHEFRHLDTVEWSQLFRDSEIVPIDGVDIRILSPEDHLRILCVHWLTDSGSDKERLWDIYYAVQNRPAHFDWHKCLGRVSETRRKWIVCTIGLAKKYLGLDLNGLPFADEAEDLPAWLTNSIEREWKLGVPLRGLYDSLHDWTLFVKQVRKRIPPNPLYATIESEGEFDDRSRAPYQLRSLLRRIVPGARKIAITLMAGKQKNGK